MRRAQSSRRGTLARAITGISFAVLVAAPNLPAQSKSVSPAPTLMQPVAATFQALANASRFQDYTAVQIRRFRDAAGNMAAVRERLVVDANGTDLPAFSVTFLGVEGVLPGSATHSKWQQTYSLFAPLFYSHGSFRVKNLAAALSNYTIHDFGVAVRTGRSANRTVVFPNSMDKAIWVIDVDALTKVPLYQAEFDAQMRLLSEVEVVSFTDSVAATPPLPSGVSRHGDYQAAKSFMGHPGGVIDPNVGLTSDYQLSSVEVRDDPLNGLQTMVLTYTDGIDQFMVCQTPNATDVFDGFPMKGEGQTIARYRDHLMSVLYYWEGGVLFQVAGRGSLHRLDTLTRMMYLQALSSN